MTFPSQARYALIGKETTWATGGSATKDTGLLISDISTPITREVIESSSISSTAVQKITTGIVDPGVNLSGDIQHGRLFEYLIGSVAHDNSDTPDIKHTFTVPTGAASAVMEVGNNLVTDEILTTTGLLAESGELSIALNGNLQLSCNFKGKTPTSSGGTLQIDDCETANWNDSADMTTALDAVTFKQGAKSLSLTKDATATVTASTSKTTTSRDFTSKEFHMWLYIINTAALEKLKSTDCLEIRFGSAAGDYYSWKFDRADLTTGWNKIVDLDTTNATVTGTPSIAACDYTYIGLTAISSATVWSAGDMLMDDLETFAGSSAVLSTLPVFPQVMCDVKLDGTSASEVQEASISITKTLEGAGGIGSNLYQQRHETGIKFEFSAKLGFDDKTFIQLFLGGTGGATTPPTTLDPGGYEFLLQADNTIAAGSGRREIHLQLENCQSPSFDETTSVGGLTFIDITGTGTLKSCFTYDNITEANW